MRFCKPKPETYTSVKEPPRARVGTSTTASPTRRKNVNISVTPGRPRLDIRVREDEPSLLSNWV